MAPRTQVHRAARVHSVTDAQPSPYQWAHVPLLCGVVAAHYGAVKIRMCRGSTLACRSNDPSGSRVTPYGSNALLGNLWLTPSDTRYSVVKGFKIASALAKVFVIIEQLLQVVKSKV